MPFSTHLVALLAKCPNCWRQHTHWCRTNSIFSASACNCCRTHHVRLHANLHRKNARSIVVWNPWNSNRNLIQPLDCSSPKMPFHIIHLLLCMNRQCLVVIDLMGIVALLLLVEVLLLTAAHHNHYLFRYRDLCKLQQDMIRLWAIQMVVIAIGFCTRFDLNEGGMSVTFCDLPFLSSPRNSPSKMMANFKLTYNSEDCWLILNRNPRCSALN